MNNNMLFSRSEMACDLLDASEFIMSFESPAKFGCLATNKYVLTVENLVSGEETILNKRG